jgi:hypothetical protein
MQNAWGGPNNNGQYNTNNQSNQGNQYQNNGGNFNNGPPQGNYNSSGQFHGQHMGGFSQAPSFNSYGKSDGPMDPPRGQQSSGRQGQGPPGQPPRLFSPPPPGQGGNTPGSSSGPQGQPPRVFSPGPSQGQPQRVFSPGPSQGQPPRLFSPGPESGPRGQQRANPFPPGMGFDPARLQSQAGPSSWITNKRVDLPGTAYAVAEGVSPLLISFPLPYIFSRSAFCTPGPVLCVTTSGCCILPFEFCILHSAL